MTSNIYEDPNQTVNAAYSKGCWENGGERVERLVDIYESADDPTGPPDWTRGSGQTRSSRPGPGPGPGPRPGPVRRTPLRASVLLLGFLSLLLLAGIAVLYKLFVVETKSHKDLQTRYEKLSNGFCQPNGTEGNFTSWRRFECRCYYKSTEMKTWTDSRRDCETRGAHLVIVNNREEQDFVGELNEGGASWIGLQAVRRSQWDTTKWEWEWVWVDGTTATYFGWRSGQVVLAEDGAVGYVDLDGLMNHNSSGSKHWICERKMF